MAYNNYGMMGGYNNYPQDVNYLQNQLNQLRNMQSQIQSPIPNQPQPPSNGVTQIGTYVVVKSIQDMENYPVPVDGTPVNVFVEGTGAFYSKKMTNGTVSCQPFSFSPLNTVKTDVATEPQKDETPEWAMALLDRVCALEERITPPKKSKKVEVDGDGI